MNVTRSALLKTVYGIVQAQPSGLKHAEVVHEVRRLGFVYGPGLSAEIHSILTGLVTAGAIIRNQDERMDRRYKPATSGKNRLRILIVDDNVDYADSNATLLKYAGYEVRTVYSGEDAVEAAQDWNPDFVLLDIGLPVMDGYDTARSLRKSRLTTTLVAMTGREDRRASKEAGFDYHLVKPVEDQELLELIGACPFQGSQGYGRPMTLTEEFA